MNKKIKKNSIVNKRLKILFYFTIILFAVVIYKFCDLVLVEGDKYRKKLYNMKSSYVTKESAPRGKIYDRNHKLLVDNKSVPIIIYRKDKKKTIKEEIDLAYKVSKIIDVDYSKLSLVNLKEFWIDQNKDLADSKITNDEWNKLKNRKINMEDIKRLKIERITEKDLSKYNNEDKEVAYIYYLMNKGYMYEDKIIKKGDVNNSEYAYIAEHKDELGGFDVSYTWERVYLYGDTFRTVLGSISSINYENKDEYLKKGYELNDVVGVSYIEKQYEDVLKGTKSKYKVENNNLVLLEEGKRGNDIVLTIDIELQKQVEDILKKQVVKAKKDPGTKYYNKSYVVIQEPNTGEILSMSGIQVIKSGSNYKTYDVTPGILTNPMTVGSVVKGASMTVGYKTGAIDIGDYFTDSCVKIYLKPAKCSWTRLGNINDINALAYSSNIYQFKTAMKVDGYKYVYNGKFNAKKSTFDTYRNVFNEYGLGVKTGIDLPVESMGNIGKDYSSDLLLNFTIGQYDTYTPMQLSQYITTIASNGNRYQPHLLKEVIDSSYGKTILKKKPKILNKVSVDKKYISRIQKGFKAVLEYGTGKNIMGDISKASGKTGTSESFLDTNGDGIVDTETVSNAFVGYAPYNNPKMTITVTSPDLINPKSNARSYINHKITREISEKFFEMYK